MLMNITLRRNNSILVNHTEFLLNELNLLIQQTLINMRQKAARKFNVVIRILFELLYTRSAAHINLLPFIFHKFFRINFILYHKRT